MKGLAVRMLPYVLSFSSSLCIMVLELVASRLVARHVGASLSVWTSVIGIMLGGICLGNVLGGRLADRVEPGRAIGPLYALGSLLTVGCLWLNAVVGETPGLNALNWEMRTIVVVSLDFLVPATVLGMIGPVVAKMAVEQARKAGSAIGDIYFFGALGSIAGTFLAGFVLMYEAPISAIVTVVAATLALLSAALIDDRRGAARDVLGATFFLMLFAILLYFAPILGIRNSQAIRIGFGSVIVTLTALFRVRREAALGLLAAALLGLGSISPVVRALHIGSFTLGSTPISYLALAGHFVAFALAIVGANRLKAARLAHEEPAADDQLSGDMALIRPKLTDLAVLSFVASMAFMALEMVAGRLVTRHLGSSIYGWTSIIGVMLGGLSLGNYLGGKVADYIKSEKGVSWLFLVASLLTISILLFETPPKFVSDHLLDGSTKSVLSQAISWSELKLPGGSEFPMRWPARVLLVTTLVFFLPSLALGTVSPVVAKLAVERLRRSKRTGTAIGQVYAWGMVGSILGTFLTGFMLIDWLGTKGVVLVLGASLAFAATALGSVWHAAWAGIPLGLCVIAFVPAPWFVEQGKKWGLREELGDLHTTEDANAWVDESNYYYIKVTNEPDAEGQKRTLVLDNLIHGYFILGHPERLDYDYEHVYALVAHRIAQAKRDAARQRDGQPEPLRTLFLGGGAYTFQRYMQHTYARTAVDVAEIDPAVNRANKIATGLLPFDLPDYATLDQTPKGKAPKEGVTLEDRTRLAKDGKSKETYRAVILKVAGEKIDLGEYQTTESLGAYEALRASTFPTIRTVLGDARQFVEKNQDKKKYDIVFGDAFNDFSVPWHLTTLEFNTKLAKMLGDDGVYMINIIDAYESEAKIEERAARKIKKDGITTEAGQARVIAAERAKAYSYCGFLGAWVNTAKKTFPHVYIFGTDDVPGGGLRETFVVVASKKPLDLDDLGSRDDDPKFFERDRLFEPRPFSKEHEAAVDKRSRGIILTDDYAPVENLLAPVAETRGDD